MATAVTAAIIRSRTPGLVTSTVSATLVATIRQLTSQTPPSEAGASNAGTCHWLAPSNPHGPPSADQDRIASINTHPAGMTSNPAANRRPDGRGDNSHHTAADHGIHRRPRSAAATTRNGPVLGSSQ